jgi:hypothetical protein
MPLLGTFLTVISDRSSGDSPDEKIFTPTDERGFLPYTPHPTPHTLHPTPYTPHPTPSFKSGVRSQEIIFIYSPHLPNPQPPTPNPHLPNPQPPTPNPQPPSPQPPTPISPTPNPQPPTPNPQPPTPQFSRLLDYLLLKIETRVNKFN